MVLILVFVEFTLRVLNEVGEKNIMFCLNPCFCGIYSQSQSKKVKEAKPVTS